MAREQRAPRVGLEPNAAGLTGDQQRQYEEDGYVHLEGVFDAGEIETLGAELDRLIEEWAVEDMGWSGDWREDYLDPDQREGTSLIHLHDLQFYSAAWERAVTDPRMVAPATDCLGPDVELHHSTLHAKPPDRGSPFPMHQDWAFYKHEGPAYVDALVHVDDVPSEKGPLQFVPGSHENGALEHIEGEGQAPHLPTDEYGLEDAVEVPASAGDVILFNYHTIHGSDLNRTDEMRRLVRVGYRDPANEQYAGQSVDREGVMLAGRKRR
jgi:ectoine hydroxylase-related dioxygenase (phytanoyl-CoA dioxygenase family)